MKLLRLKIKIAITEASGPPPHTHTETLFFAKIDIHVLVILSFKEDGE